MRDGFKSQVLVDSELARTVADAAEPAAATATGEFTDGDIPDSESSDDSEDETQNSW